MQNHRRFGNVIMQKTSNSNDDAKRRLKGLKQDFKKLLDISGPQPDKAKNQIFNQALHLTRETALQCIKANQDTHYISKVLNQSFTIGRQISHFKMIGFYACLAKQCLEQGMQKLPTFIEKYQREPLSDIILRARQKWLPLGTVYLKQQSQKLMQKCLICLTKTLVDYKDEKTINFFIYWFTFTSKQKYTKLYFEIMINLFQFMGAYPSSIKSINTTNVFSTFLDIYSQMKEISKTSLLYGVKWNFSLTARFINENRSRSKPLKKKIIQEFIPKFLAKMNKFEDVVAEVYVFCMEINEHQTFANHWDWKKEEVKKDIKKWLCSVSAYLKYVFENKIYSALEILYEQFKGLLRSIQKLAYLDKFLIHIFNQINAFQSFFFAQIKISQGTFKNLSTDSPLLKLKPLFQIKRAIILSHNFSEKKFNSQNKKLAFLPKIISQLIISEWAHKQNTEKSLLRISELLKQLNELSQYALPPWKNLFMIATSNIQQSKSLWIFGFLLKCDKIIFRLVTEDSGYELHFNQILETKNETLLKKIFITLKQNLLKELFKLSSNRHKNSSYYNFFGFFVILHVITCHLTLEEENEENMHHIQRMCQIAICNGQISLLQQIYKKYTKNFLREMSSEQLSNAIQTYFPLCRSGNQTKQNINFIDYVKFLQMNLKKNSIPTFKVCEEIIGEKFGSLKSFFHEILRRQPLDLEIFLECLVKIIHLENEQQNESDFEELNIEFELQEFCIRTKNIHGALSMYENWILLFFQKVGTFYNYSLYKISPHLENNLHRIITCCNNIIVVCHNIGRQNLRKIMMQFKLSLIKEFFSEYFFDLQVSKAIFLEYLQPNPEIILDLKNKYFRQSDSVSRKIQFYMKWHEMYEPASESKLNSMIYILKNLKHFHSDKDMIKGISECIQEKSYTEKQMLKNQGSLLPIQYCYTQISSLQNWLLDGEMRDIIPHSVFRKCLEKILSAILCNGQKSSMKSMFKLAAIYLMRSRNPEGCLLALQCYLQKKQKDFDLRILIVLDCFSSILKQQYPGFSSHEIASLFQSKRRSVSHLYNAQIFGKKLGKSLNKCGRIGDKLLWFFLKYLGITFNIPIHQCYIQYLEQKNKNYDTIVQKKMREVFKLSKNIFSTLDCLQKLVPISIYHAAILESKIAYSYEVDDKTLFQISILMLDHNYCYKSMVQQLPVLKPRNSSIAQVISQSNSIFEKYLQNYHKNHEEKKKYLLKNLQHPLSILYPFGNKIYNIAVMKPLTITSVDRYDFEDKISAIFKFLEKDSKILNTKDISARDWSKGRERIDREFNQLLSTLEMGIFDTEVPQKVKLQASKKNLDERICKFIGQELNENLKDNLAKYCKNTNSALSFLEQRKNVRLKRENLMLLVHRSLFSYPYQSAKNLKHRFIYRVPSISYI